MKRVMGLIGLAVLAASCGDVAPTEVVITNGGERELYVQQNHELTLYADGAAVSMNEPTCMAECGLFQGQIACALAAEYPTVRIMAPDAQHTTDWDGTYYEVPDGRNCWKKRTGDADFEMEVCYSDEYESFEENGPEPTNTQIPGATLKNEVCERQAFERGDVVELVIE